MAKTVEKGKKKKKQEKQKEEPTTDPTTPNDDLAHRMKKMMALQESERVHIARNEVVEVLAKRIVDDIQALSTLVGGINALEVMEASSLAIDSLKAMVAMERMGIAPQQDATKHAKKGGGKADGAESVPGYQ